MKGLRLIFLAVVAVASVGPASLVVRAQTISPVQVRGGFSLSTTSYSKMAAERSNTVNRSFGFHTVVEPRLYDVIALPVVVGWEYLGPICLDWESSVDCSAAREERTSLLFAGVGAALYGPPIPLSLDEEDRGGRPFFVVGREWVSRGIGDDGCLNCILESVRFSGGLFVEPGLELPAGEFLSVSVSYRMYEGASDLENRFNLRFSTRGRLWH
jgi:hypothetical protein